MSEQLREALSAAVDGEASEFELRRVFDEIAKDQSLARAWQSYHLIKQAAQGENVQDVERMGERIWASLDSEQFLEQDIIQEEPLADTAQPATAGRFKLFGGALAAALALAVVLSSSFLDSNSTVPGSNPLSADAPADGLVDRGPSINAVQPGQTLQTGRIVPVAAGSFSEPAELLVANGTVANGAVRSAGFDGSSDYDYGPGFVPYSELSPADQARSDGYFLHHVQHQAVNNDNVLSFVKMISYPQ